MLDEYLLVQKLQHLCDVLFMKTGKRHNNIYLTRDGNKLVVFHVSNSELSNPNPMLYITCDPEMTCNTTIHRDWDYAKYSKQSLVNVYELDITRADPCWTVGETWEYFMGGYGALDSTGVGHVQFKSHIHKNTLDSFLHSYIPLNNIIPADVEDFICGRNLNPVVSTSIYNNYKILSRLLSRYLVMCR